VSEYSRAERGAGPHAPPPSVRACTLSTRFYLLYTKFYSISCRKNIEPGLESTFEYLFMPSETFNGRPMGLVVLINYQNNVREIINLVLIIFEDYLGRETISKCCF
jgi:hypothetical protein